MRPSHHIEQIYTSYDMFADLNNDNYRYELKDLRLGVSEARRCGDPWRTMGLGQLASRP